MTHPPGPSPSDAGLGALEAFRARIASAGLFLDFDGTLSDIVERPELARPVEGAADAVRELAGKAALVAIVSGRPQDDVIRLFGMERLEVFGLYGLEGRDVDVDAIRAARPDVEEAVRDVDGAWVEDKRLSLAVHYRASSEPELAHVVLADRLGRVAVRRGLFVLPGKMVLELAPSATPGKGSVVLREVRARELRACLYAGDDEADVGAFAALDELRAQDVATVKIAVHSPEAPAALLDAADVVVERPARLVGLLRSLL